MTACRRCSVRSGRKARSPAARIGRLRLGARRTASASQTPTVMEVSGMPADGYRARVAARNTLWSFSGVPSRVERKGSASWLALSCRRWHASKSSFVTARHLSSDRDGTQHARRRLAHVRDHSPVRRATFGAGLCALGARIRPARLRRRGFGATGVGAPIAPRLTRSGVTPEHWRSRQPLRRRFGSVSA
jgi:hypothetical protein